MYLVYMYMYLHVHVHLHGFQFGVLIKSTELFCAWF